MPLPFAPGWLPGCGGKAVRTKSVQPDGALASTSPWKIIIAPLAGQSNNEGRGTFREGEDTDVSGLWHYVNYSGDPNYQQITADTTPLLSSNPFAGAGGYGSDRVGPGEYFGRSLLANNEGAEVVLVPLAVGGTTLSVNSPVWKSSATPGAGGSLFENMISATNDAIAKANAKWPGVPVEVVLSWVQGEFDATFTTPATRSQYLSDLTDLIARFRARVTGASAAPVVIGSMIPYFWQTTSSGYNANYAAINAAHVDASLTISGVRYMKGPGNGSEMTTDFLHYSPALWVRQQGTRNGSALYDTAGPSITNAPIIGNTPATVLNVALAHDDTYGHATFHIVGGADAAQFEISDPYLTPTLRWTSNGTGPAAGTYAVQVAARDGSGNYGSAKSLSVIVSTEVHPATLFQSGERGQVWDLSDWSNLSQTVDGLTPVTAVGQSVGWVRDLSPNAAHFVAPANDSRRPLLQQDATTGKYYLSFDGSNDVLHSPLPFITDTDGRSTLVFGFRAATPASQRSPLGSYNSLSITPFFGPEYNTDGTFKPQMRNDASSTGGTQPSLAGGADNTDKIINTGYNGSNSTWRVRNAFDRPSDGGASAGYSSVTQGTNSQARTGLDRTTMGARGFPTISNYHAGRLYSGFTISRYLTDSEVKAGEEWVNNRSTATALPGQTTTTSGALSASGIGALSLAGTAVAAGALAASGSGAVSATGGSTAAADLSATGTATVAATGASTAEASLSGTGTASGAPVGSSVATAAFSGAATGDVSAGGGAIGTAALSASASGGFAGTGATAGSGVASGALSASGSGGLAETGAIVSAGGFSASGSGNLTEGGARIVEAALSASGAGAANDNGAQVATAALSSSGSGSSESTSSALASGAAVSEGFGVLVGAGISIAEAALSGSGSGLVRGRTVETPVPASRRAAGMIAPRSAGGAVQSRAAAGNLQPRRASG